MVDIRVKIRNVLLNGETFGGLGTFYFNLYWNAVIQSTPVAGEYFGLHMKTQYTTVCGLKEETMFTLLQSLVNSRLRVVQQL